MGSNPGSPSFSDSSGGSDLMALLDQELETDNVEAVTKSCVLTGGKTNDGV